MDKELLEMIKSMASFGEAIADDYYKKGFYQGVLKEKIAVAKRLKEMGLSIEQIAEGSGLSIRKVKKILRGMTK